MDEVTQVCDRVLVLKNGTIIANDTPLALASSVSKSHVHLLITHGLQNAINFAQKENLDFKINKQEFSFEVDEDKIGQILIAIANNGVQYTSVSIDKPSMEDYFLSISKKLKLESK
jgi:ABC-2 type transport system ATP-binding protein